MLLLLLEQIVLLLNESLKAHLLKITAKLVILLLQLLNILVFHGKLAHMRCNLFLLLRKLLFEISFDTLNFFLLFGQVVLGFLKLSDQLFVIELGCKFLLSRLLFILELDHFRLSLGAIMLILGLHLGQAQRAIRELLRQIPQLR